MSHGEYNKLIEYIARQDEVIGLFAVGSTAYEVFKPYSDYDLIIVLKSKPGILFMCTAEADGKLVEMIFTSEDELKNLLAALEICVSSDKYRFANWVKGGQILVDKNGLLQKTKNKIREIFFSEFSYGERQVIWNKIHYNYSQNKRYFSSNEEIYHQALEIRLLYSMEELFGAYLKLQKIPWQGEKDFIKFISNSDLEFKNLIDEYFRANSLNDRFTTYEKIFKVVISKANKKDLIIDENAIGVNQLPSKEEYENLLNFVKQFIPPKE